MVRPSLLAVPGITLDPINAVSTSAGVSLNGERTGSGSGSGSG